MKIIDTVPYFLEKRPLDLLSLRKYHKKYEEIFHEYFLYHCKNTDERLVQELQKYPQQIKLIKEIHQKLPPVIEKVVVQYRERLQINFPINVHLIVGGFGSNAYTHRQIIPDITFALERLSSFDEHLQVIVAHEFGHAAQNILTNNTSINWDKLNWTSPFIWINQEGAATYLSKQIVPYLFDNLYFHYESTSDDWLEFAKSNEKYLKEHFLRDVDSLSSEDVFLEWFSIRGGSNFQFNRLGYYLGYAFFESQVERIGELEAIIAWKEKDFESNVLSWLQK